MYLVDLPYRSAFVRGCFIGSERSESRLFYSDEFCRSARHRTSVMGTIFRFCDVGRRPTPESLLNFSGEASAGRFSGDGKTRFREIYDGKTMGGREAIP